MGSELVVVLNAHNELCAVQKGGGSAVNPSEVMRAFAASQMTKDATDALKRAHAAWEEERDKRRVRRHYGAEAAANPDFGLPDEAMTQTRGGARGGGGRPEGEDEEEEEGKSDSDDDFRGRGGGGAGADGGGRRRRGERRGRGRARARGRDGTAGRG